MIAPGPVSTTTAPPKATGLLLRALAAWLAMGVGLGAAGAIGDAGGLSGWADKGLTAAVCCAVVVTAIVALRRGVDRLPLAGIGVTPLPGGLARFGFGLAVTLGAAALVFGGGAAAGLIGFGAVDVPRLLEFLALNAVIALALEAVPEELAFRGYILTTLNRRLPAWGATVIQIGLFASIMVVVSPAQSLTAMALSGGEFTFSPAPDGTHPVDYLILMVFFGYTLTCARLATGSVWTTIGLHLAFLTANRLTIAGSGRDTGWDVTATGGAALLVPVYLGLVVVAFMFIAGGRIGWRTVRP